MTVFITCEHGKTTMNDCSECLRKLIQMTAERDQARKEAEEQARLNDMRASREAKLMAEVKRLRDQIGVLSDNLKASAVQNARLHGALERIKKMEQDSKATLDDAIDLAWVALAALDQREGG